MARVDQNQNWIIKDDKSIQTYLMVPMYFNCTWKSSGAFFRYVQPEKHNPSEILDLDPGFSPIFIHETPRSRP
jgi:hypothetical protein